MKNRRIRFISLALVLALLLPLVSCQNEARAQLDAELEALRAENEAKIQAAGAAGTAEAQAAPDKTRTLPDHPDWEGILSGEYAICGTRFYYNVQVLRTIPAPSGVGYNRSGFVVHYYTDLVTLDSNSVCPDPLCRHDDLFTCMYTEFGSSANFWAVGNDWFYVVKRDFGKAWPNFFVYKIDMNTNKAKMVYDPIDVMASFVGEEDGVMVLRDAKSTLDAEGKTASREDYLVGLSVETDEVLFQHTVPENGYVFLIRNGKAFCIIGNCLVRCDLDFENREVLFDKTGLGSFETWYYDENTDELWFSLTARNTEAGRVFRIKADGESEEIHLPAENIYFFQLTNSKIYYSVNEPRRIGSHSDTVRDAYDPSGGRIYAVSRDNPGEDPALVYDTEGKTLLCEHSCGTYKIFGDQLFFPVAEVVREANRTYFSYAWDVPMEHIDLTTGEEEIIGLD